MQGGNLLLSKVTKDEVGKYVCRAENLAAVRETPQIHLGVHGESLDLIFRVLLYEFKIGVKSNYAGSNHDILHILSVQEYIVS